MYGTGKKGRISRVVVSGSLPLERCEGDSHGRVKKGMGKMRKLIGKLVRIHNHPVLSDMIFSCEVVSKGDENEPG